MSKYVIVWYYITLSMFALTSGIYLASKDYGSSAVMFTFMLLMLRIRRKIVHTFKGG